MNITFRGAAREVGRSCFDISTKSSRILLDCGIALTPEGNVYPEQLSDLNKVSAIFLSHAHLDHSGALALEEHSGLKCPIFCTPETRELTNMLLRDSYHIDLHSHVTVDYREEDIDNVIRLCKEVSYKKDYSFKDIKFSYHDACHIPGSSAIFMQTEEKKILYTGDFNNTETRLMSNKLEFPQADIMISECTYGDRDHPQRKTTEKRFLQTIKKTVDNNGSVLVPAFAVGRAQEMLILLQELHSDIPIYIDGMAVAVTRNMLKYGKFVKDEGELSDAFGNTFIIKDERDRKQAMKEPGVFVTPSGMLTGGPVVQYLKSFIKNSNDTIILTGYQALGTNGRSLLETGSVTVDGYNVKAQCQFSQFDFSAHIGMKELQKTIKQVNPEKLILVHGEESSADKMHTWAESQGFKTFSPKILDSLKL